jgi:hypothetical protein
VAGGAAAAGVPRPLWPCRASGLSATPMGERARGRGVAPRRQPPSGFNAVLDRPVKQIRVTSGGMGL